MIKRIAVIGDIHGTIDELIELYNKLQWISLDEIWSVGDLTDRGPDSGACVQFCLDNNIKAVLGNHEDNIIGPYETFKKNGRKSRNLDKQRTIEQLKDHHIEWFKTLPILHVFDDINTVIAHGGLYPKIPLYAQPINVIRAQLIHPDMPGRSRWWGTEADPESMKTEAQSREEGFERWYRLYDHQQNVIFGHSTFSQPMIYQNPGYGKCIGIDTGSSFGGCLTACIMDSTEHPFFIAVKNKKVYCKSTSRQFWEE